jgi:hypothetical protein
MSGRFRNVLELRKMLVPEHPKVPTQPCYSRQIGAIEPTRALASDGDQLAFLQDC